MKFKMSDCPYHIGCVVASFAVFFAGSTVLVLSLFAQCGIVWILFWYYRILAVTNGLK
jgi:hypothetical protein